MKLNTVFLTSFMLTMGIIIATFIVQPKEALIVLVVLHIVALLSGIGMVVSENLGV